MPRPRTISMYHILLVGSLPRVAMEIFSGMGEVQIHGNNDTEGVGSNRHQ